MTEIKCPETIEELEELERRLPLCRKGLYEAAKAKIESGVACSRREAERQLAEETGKPLETIRTAIKREVGSMNPPNRTPQNSPVIGTQAPPINPAHTPGPGPKYEKTQEPYS